MSEEHRPGFLGRPVQGAFDVRRVVVDPGAERAFDEAEWSDAVVVVESGGIELECRCGSRRRFSRGHVLWLTGLPLRALRNRERTPTVLVAVSRRPSADEFSDRAGS